MIDPRKVTDFERTDAQLEEFLLFAIVVAGKGAFIQAQKLDQFLKCGRMYRFGDTPFDMIQCMDQNKKLVDALRLVKMGQYERIGTAFRGVSAFFSEHVMGMHQLRGVDVQTLECVKGIGMKTARFFMMHTRRNQVYACLDTHILRWLGSKGHEVPKTTPRGEKYLALEQVFLGYCEKAGKTPAEMDLEIWNSQHLEDTSKKNLTTAYTSVIVGV